MADGRSTSQLQRSEAERADAADEPGRGAPGWEDPAADPALGPVVEAGGGEAEGFELAEQELIENATHSDEQGAHAVLHHAGRDEEATMAEDAEPDHEHSSELDEEGFDDYDELDEEELEEEEDED
jgi:hypothetical protein